MPVQVRRGAPRGQGVVRGTPACQVGSAGAVPAGRSHSTVVRMARTRSSKPETRVRFSHRGQRDVRAVMPHGEARPDTFLRVSVSFVLLDLGSGVLGMDVAVGPIPTGSSPREFSRVASKQRRRPVKPEVVRASRTPGATPRASPPSGSGPALRRQARAFESRRGDHGAVSIW